MEQLIAALAIVGGLSLFLLVAWIVCYCIVARCPACGSKRTTICATAKFYEVWRCHRCESRWDVRINPEDSIYG